MTHNILKQQADVPTVKIGPRWRNNEIIMSERRHGGELGNVTATQLQSLVQSCAWVMLCEELWMFPVFVWVLTRVSGFFLPLKITLVGGSAT